MPALHCKLTLARNAKTTFLTVGYLTRSLSPLLERRGWIASETSKTGVANA